MFHGHTSVNFQKGPPKATPSAARRFYYGLGIFAHYPRKSHLFKASIYGIGIELLYIEYALAVPFSCHHHHGADHGRYAGGVGNSLGADLFITFLMVADIVDINGLFLSVLYAGEDTADVGLSDGSGT